MPRVTQLGKGRLGFDLHGPASKPVRATALLTAGAEKSNVKVINGDKAVSRAKAVGLSRSSLTEKAHQPHPLVG